MAEYCARCKRRKVVGYHVAEDVKRLVLLNRWKSPICAACFDELAEQGGIAYSFEDVEAVSWSERTPSSGRSKRRR